MKLTELINLLLQIIQELFDVAILSARSVIVDQVFDEFVRDCQSAREL